MTPKPTCKNCGACDYKAIPNGYECEYCGTEYETSEKQDSHVVSHRLMPLNIEASWERMDYVYKSGETRYYNKRDELMRVDSANTDYLTQEEILAMGVQPKGFFNEVADGINSVGSMFDCIKTLFGR